MTRTKKNVLFTLVLFYVVFPFSLNSIHLEQDIFNLAASFLIIIFNISYMETKIGFFSKKMMISFLLVSFLGVLSLIIPFLYGTFDISFFRIIFFSTIQAILKFTAILLIFVRLYKGEATLVKFSWAYIAVCCLYFFFTILFMMFPIVKEFWVSNLYVSELDIIQLNKPQYITRVGIDGFAGFGQTFKFAIGIMLSIFLIMRNTVTDRKKMFFLISALLIMLVGTLFYGRIGSVAGIMGIVFLMLFLFSKPSTLKVGFTFIVVCLLLIVALLLASLVNESIRVWFEWAFELILNFIQSGEFSSASTDILFERMYFIPELKPFLMGDGFYTDPLGGGYYMSTDVGFMRTIHFFGVFPTILTYAVVGFILAGMKKELHIYGKGGDILIGLLVLTFIVFELKGGIYHVFYPLLIPFYGILLFQKNQLN